MKKILFSLLLSFSITATYTQSLDFQTTVFYTAEGNVLTSSGENLSAFNFGSSSLSHPLWNGGIYYPVKDYAGNNLWVKVSYLSSDPNGTTVGVSVTSSAGSPFRSGAFGGWAGFLYQFNIYKDANLTGTPANILNGFFQTNITVESIETLSSGELVLFEITNDQASNWVLNSINFTGNNPGSNPGFSGVSIPWNDSKTGFSTTFPASKNIYVIDYGSGGSYAEFSMSADNVSAFRYGYEFTGGAGGYQGMRMSFGVPSTTPLNLISFNAVANNDGINLNWITAQENGTKYFDVERSNDGVSFETIASKVAHGTGENNYFETDLNPLNGTNYYRLKITDLDGELSYSKIIRLSVNTSKAISFYPNPVKNDLNIVSSKSQEIWITDVAGKLIERRKLNSGINKYNISRYSPGIYFIKTSGKAIGKILKD